MIVVWTEPSWLSVERTTWFGFSSSSETAVSLSVAMPPVLSSVALERGQPGAAAALGRVEVQAGELLDLPRPVAQRVAVHGQRRGRGGLVEAVLDERRQRAGELARQRAVDGGLERLGVARGGAQQQLREAVGGAHDAPLAARDLGQRAQVLERLGGTRGGFAERDERRARPARDMREQAHGPLALGD